MSRKVIILALGGAGCHIIRELEKFNHSSRIKILAMDTDIECLKVTGLPEDQCIQAGKMWRNGRGCGSDSIAGQRAASNERATLEAQFQGADLLLAVGGLGRGFCTGSLSVVLSVAAKMKIFSIVLATTPFSHEGYVPRKLADETIANDIVELADVLLTVSNDLLFSTLDPNTPYLDAYKFSDQQMAKTVMALSEIMLAGNLFNVDFAGFSTLLKRRKSSCAIGVGEAASGEKGPEQVVESLLTSPLLGGETQLSEADAVIFTLLGDKNLSLSQAKSTLDLAAKQVGNECKVLLAAGTIPEWNNNLQLTATAIKFNDRVVFEEEKTQRRTARRSAKQDTINPDDVTQPTLPWLEEVDTGIMERTTPVFVDNENLDIPTFKRRNIIL